LTRPGKDASLVVRQRDPFNAEPPLEALVERALTPPGLFFVRSHAPVPTIDSEGFRLEVDGLVERPLRLSLAELEGNFPRETVTAALQCAGNRREDLIAVADIPDDVPWGQAAIGNARWGGVPLRAVLEAAGVRPEARHVAFVGLDEVRKGDEAFGYGSSIPLDKALGVEVLLADEMDGAPLLPDHGYPLRALVPGYIGARSVKWLGRIELRAEPSSNHYQRRSYKLFPPDVRVEDADWERGLMLGELSVNSAICTPADGQTLPPGRVRVRGWAMAGGGRALARVDLSPDGGARWHEAELAPREEDSPWAWRLWERELALDPGEHELAVRAWDEAANTQPEDPAKIWNFKGYMSHAWHRVRVRVASD